MAETSVRRVDGSGKRILVIDDDLAIRILLRAVLKRMRFTVDLAEDGAAGLERLQDGQPYALILLDLMMPRLSGYEFIDEIRKRYGVDRPHVVVFTAAGKRGVDKIPPDSVCASILKPFDLDSFIDIISECLEESHHPPSESSIRPDG